jgi:MFS family permease
MAMYSVAAILCQLGIGPLIDRFGRKPFILLGALLVTAVPVAFLFSTRLGWPFYALRFLQGMAFAAFMTSNLTLLADLVPASRRAEAVGVFGVSGLVTIALAPALGEIVLRAYGFPALFAGAVLLGIGTLAVCLVTEVPTPMAVETPRALGPGFWRTFTPVIIASFQFGLANSIVFVFLPPFARYVGLPRFGPFTSCTLTAVAVRFLGPAGGSPGTAAGDPAGAGGTRSASCCSAASVHLDADPDRVHQRHSAWLRVPCSKRHGLR